MSTFSGLSGALSSLYAQRRGMDVTGQNIANANTEGYSRQRVDLKAVGGSAVPALFSVSDGSSGGVTVSNVARIQDVFLEARGRIEHAQSSYLADQSRALTNIQQAFGEPSTTGLQSQMADLWSSWHDLVNSPGDKAARTQVLGRATTLTETMHSMHDSMASLFTTTREQFDAYTTDVNTTATQVAQLNQAVIQATNADLPSNELADQRDLLVSNLSKLTGATALARANGSVDVYLGGSSLVSGVLAREISATGARRLDDAIATPVALRWADTGGAVAPQSGQMASMLQTLNTTVLHYSGQLDQVAADLAGAVNTQHARGYDLSGNPGGAFFASTTSGPITAQNITVAITDYTLIAAAKSASSTGGGTFDGTNADSLAGIGKVPGGPDQAYRTLVVDLGVAGQTAERRATIQSALTDDVDAARQGQSGVNLDEEMTNLITYQRAYQAASRVISTIDESLDTLINHTGR